MNEVVKNEKVIASLVWKFLERGGVQVVQFIIQILLARLLLPQDYGIIGLITIFIAVANVFVESGFNTALLQKKEVDELDYTTAFTVCFIISIVLYILLFFFAPMIAHFYNMEILTHVIRILSLTLIIGAVNTIQITIYSRNFQFKKLFSCSLLSVILSGGIGVYLAYLQFGVWALVFQQLAQKTLVTLIMLYSNTWRPKFYICKQRLKSLFAFGSRLLISNLMNTLYNNIHGLVIGKVYSSDILGYYNRADQFPNIIVNNINSSLQSVLLPAMSQQQENIPRLKAMVRRTIKTSSFLIFPMMLGLAACAQSVVSLILTDKWLSCVPFLQLLCLSYALYPIHTANLQAINALGRSDIFLKLEVLKKVVGIGTLFISIPLGITVMVIFQPIVGFIFAFINAAPSRRLMNYSYWEQWKDIFPSLVAALCMGGVILMIDKGLVFPSYVKLMIEVPLGMLIYIVISKVSKNEAMNYLLVKLKNRR